MTLALGKLGPWRKNIPKYSLAMGSVAPDLALYLLSFGGVGFFSGWHGWELKATFQHMYAPNGLYFNDWWWIGLHNLFHSPTSLLLLFIASFFCLNPRFHRLHRWTTFFLAACGFHSVVDILTHFDDGPLIFFPFHWDYRFLSPISYWDTDHYGGPFMVFEGMLDVAIVAYFTTDWWRNRTHPGRTEDKTPASQTN